MASDPFGGVQAAEMMGGMFGPNQYSQFQGRIPQPGYAGTPTDAQGNPIQAAPGMTLNSAPAAPSAGAPSSGLQSMDPAGFAKLQQAAMQKAAIDPTTGMATDPQAFAQAQYYGQMGRSMMPQEVSGPSGSGRGYSTMGYAHPPTTMMWDPSSAPGASQSAAAPPSAGGSLDNALSLLSNPGKVTTPGATVPQSQIGGQPSVLQQFLANRQGGVGGGGMSYTNLPFFRTLQALQGSQGNSGGGTGDM